MRIPVLALAVVLLAHFIENSNTLTLNLRLKARARVCPTFTFAKYSKCPYGYVRATLTLWRCTYYFCALKTRPSIKKCRVYAKVGCSKGYKVVKKYNKYIKLRVPVCIKTYRLRGSGKLSGGKKSRVCPKFYRLSRCSSKYFLKSTLKLWRCTYKFCALKTNPSIKKLRLALAVKCKRGYRVAKKYNKSCRCRVPVCFRVKARLGRGRGRGSNRGGSGKKYGSSGNKYGSSGNKHGSSGKKYGSSGNKYGSSRNKYGSSGKKLRKRCCKARRRCIKKQYGLVKKCCKSYGKCFKKCSRKYKKSYRKYRKGKYSKSARKCYKTFRRCLRSSRLRCNRRYRKCAKIPNKRGSLPIRIRVLPRVCLKLVSKCKVKYGWLLGFKCQIKARKCYVKFHVKVRYCLRKYNRCNRKYGKKGRKYRRKCRSKYTKCYLAIKVKL